MQVFLCFPCCKRKCSCKKSKLLFFIGSSWAFSHFYFFRKMNGIYFRCVCRYLYQPEVTNRKETINSLSTKTKESFGQRQLLKNRNLWYLLPCWSTQALLQQSKLLFSKRTNKQDFISQNKNIIRRVAGKQLEIILLLFPHKSLPDNQK